MNKASGGACVLLELMKKKLQGFGEEVVLEVI